MRRLAVTVSRPARPEHPDELIVLTRHALWCLAGSRPGSSDGSWVGSSRLSGGERAFAVSVGGFGGLAAAEIYIGQGVIR